MTYILHYLNGPRARYSFPMVDYGDIAAGTLGYIHNGVPGIVKAVKAYRTYKYVKRHGLDKKSFPNLGLNLKNDMVPYPRTPKKTPKRKRTMSTSSSTASTRRRVGPRRPVGQPYAPRGHLVRTSRKNEGASSLRAAKVTNRTKKGVTNKKPKKVVVSRKFRQKVETALKPKTITGRFLEIGNQGFDFPVLKGNQQLYGYIGNDVGSPAIVSLFNPAWVLDCASVLFNTKTATRTAKFTATGATTNFGTNSLDFRTSKIHVNNSYSAFVFRNNSNRTWILQLYEVAPKQRMNFYSDGPFLDQWANLLQNEADTGGAGLPATFDVNLAGTTPATLYETPMIHKAMLNKWKIERHDIILDPGQTYDHFIQGPSNVTYDYQKFWKATSTAGASTEFQDLQPQFTRQFCFTARLDIIQDSTKSAARYGADDTKGRLLVEWKNYCNLQCPEQVAGLSSTAGSLENNLLRRDCYFHKHWQEVTAVPATRTEVNTATNNQ